VRKLRGLFVAGCLLGLFLPVMAGEEDGDQSVGRVEGPTVVVTANRIETPEGEVGSSQDVIDREELERLDRVPLIEVLRGRPGLSVAQSGGPGSPASVFIRGASSGQTLVLIDGVEVNDPISTTRTFDFANLTCDNIERVEIVRGPQSTLYGSDAIGGVINIITRKGAGDPTLSLAVEGGSFGSWRQQLWTGGGGEKVNYSLGVSRQTTDGVSAAAEAAGNLEEDGYENTAASARLGFTPSETFGVNVIARYSDTSVDLDNFGGAYGDDPNHVGDQTQLVLRTEAELKLLDDRWHQRLGLSISDIERTYLNDSDDQHPTDMSESTYNGSLFKVDWQHNLRLGEHNTLTLGMDTEEEKGDSVYTSESEWGPYSSVFEEQSARTTGFYLQDRIAVNDRWFTTLGLRSDDHDRFGSETTWRLTTALLFPDAGATIRGSAGTGFKAPSLYQLFSEYGSLDLEPEESFGWDLGLEKTIFSGKGSVGATWFANDFDNLLDFDPVTYVYVNIAEASTQGLELFADLAVNEKIGLAFSYTYLDTEDKTTGEELLRRANHTFRFNTNYRFHEQGNLNLDLVHVGQRMDNDFSTWPASVAELDAYLLATLAGSWDFSDHWQVSCRLENLLDEDYEEVWGYGTRGFGGYLGLKISL